MTGRVAGVGDAGGGASGVQHVARIACQTYVKRAGETVNTTAAGEVSDASARSSSKQHVSYTAGDAISSSRSYTGYAVSCTCSCYACRWMCTCKHHGAAAGEAIRGVGTGTGCTGGATSASVPIEDVGVVQLIDYFLAVSCCC